MMKDVIPENDYIAIKFIFSGRYDDEPSGEGFVFVNPKYGEQKAIELAKQWASKQKMPSIIFKKIPNDVAKQRLAQYKYPIKGIIDSIKDSVKTYRINKRYFVDAKNVKDAYKIYKKEIIKDSKTKDAKLWLEAPENDPANEWDLKIANRDASRNGFRLVKRSKVNGGPNSGYTKFYFEGPKDKLIKYAKSCDFDQSEINEMIEDAK